MRDHECRHEALFALFAEVNDELAWLEETGRENKGLEAAEKAVRREFGLPAKSSRGSPK
jgi:hypothetical protein